MEGLYAILDRRAIGRAQSEQSFGEIPSESGRGHQINGIRRSSREEKANRKDTFARYWPSTIGGEAVGFPWHRRSIEVGQAFQRDTLRQQERRQAGKPDLQRDREVGQAFQPNILRQQERRQAGKPDPQGATTTAVPLRWQKCDDPFLFVKCTALRRLIRAGKGVTGGGRGV